MFFIFLITIIKKKLFVLFLWIIVSVVIFSTNFFIYNKQGHNLRSPLKDIVVGKNQSEWKKFRVGGKNIFQMFCVLSQRYLRSLAKLLLSLVNIFFFLSFARERKYLCERTQSFARERKVFSRERKSFARERKSFARERKTFEKIFFLPPWIFFHSPRIFPTTMSLKGLRNNHI